MRLGYHIYGGAKVGGKAASMRPRRMRLGYITIHGSRPVDLGASMRPRRMRLGYDEHRLDTACRGAGFNEAEAHAPRIHEQSALYPGRAQGFNEAEAHAPRIQYH